MVRNSLVPIRLNTMKLLLITQAVDAQDPVLGFFTAWIAEFSKHCERVTVMCLRQGQSQLPQNVQVYSLGKERGVAKWVYLKTFFQLVFSKRHEYDLVFVHMNPIYLVLGGWMWRALRKRIVLWYTHKHVDWKLRLGVLFAHRVFSASRESFRLATSKLVITGHGIDTTIFAPASAPAKRQKKRLITTGRVASVKNIHKMLEVVSQLPPETFVLTIVGAPATSADERYYKGLQQGVRERGLAQCVEWAGAKTQEEIAQLLREADIYLNFSDTGSMDKGVLEAMASGVAVLSTNEAFAASADVFVASSQPVSELARELKRMLDQDMVGTKRDWVIRHHGLKELIPRLIRLANEHS